MRRILPILLVLLSVFGAVTAGTEQTKINDIAFTAACDGTEQRYILTLPLGYQASQPHDLLIALHGHGSDR